VKVLHIYLYFCLKMVVQPKHVAVYVMINSKKPTIVTLRRRNKPLHHLEKQNVLTRTSEYIQNGILMLIWVLCLKVTRNVPLSC
jgi:hypothetical protein